MNSSKQSAQSLVVSLNSALLDKNLKLASDLISRACDSQQQFLRCNEVMFMLLSGCGVDFKKEDNYVDFLLKALKVASSDPVGQFKTAVLRGDVDAVEALLRSNDNKVLLSNHESYQSFILYAFTRCNIGTRVQLLKLMIDNGLMINPKALTNKEGNLLHVFLWWFAKSNDADLLDVTALLVDAGLSLEEIDAHGRTPLHICIQLKLTKVVSYFVNVKHVDVNVKTKTGSSPLHLAALDGDDTEDHLDMIKILLSREDLDVNAKDDEGATPLLIAKKYNNNDKIAEFLLQSGADDVEYSPFGDMSFTPDQAESIKTIISKLEKGEALTASEEELNAMLKNSHIEL